MGNHKANILVPNFLIFYLVISSNINSFLCTEVPSNSENQSEIYFNTEDPLRNETYNDTLYNQTYESLNDTNGEFLANLTNTTQPDMVVTEDGETTEKNTPEQIQKYLYFATSDEDICSCDLNSNYCDINCCCDPDCSEEDVKVFSNCHSRPLVPDKYYCYQSDIILKNNTVYKMVKDPESSLFCIVHDNLKQHLRFNEIPVLKSHRDLDTLLEYQSKFISSWKDKEDSVEPESINLKAGSPIKIEYLNAKQKVGNTFWKLPAACFTRMCSCNQDVRYLEDFDSACSRAITNHREECTSNAFLLAETFTEFCIASHSDISTALSSLIAHTKAANSTNKPDGCTKIRFESNILKPKYLYGFCFNVVSGVRFRVTHNGVYGISDVSVELSYINISEADTMISQRFSVQFEWDNVTDIERRSGNPGYQIGLPILTGTNSSISELLEIKMQQNGLSVLDRDIEGRCNSERRMVKFGKNYKTDCVLKYAKTNCKSLQERIYNILLGSSQKQVFVGVFGNANASNAEDWIEAYHEDREVVQPEDGTCNFILGLKINVAFAAVGTVVNPQYKILGVGYHYAKPEKVDLSCSPACQDLMLSASVSFFDVTEPAIPHYPKVPTIKANLPSDFFYPFLRGKQATFASNVYLVIFLVIVALVK
ncbi:hypothetical protein JTE90_002867 [Oedothorax gibbosus]|uniref:Tectonic n=1 Tax=Oedothorax gibbosus TaxID=931172 RepID=A0AAV6TV96_9ARAC|nr:hypothetical protein JTE90_002867 [Oedothorax gibbosus]